MSEMNEMSVEGAVIPGKKEKQDESLYYASQSKMIWIAFKQHRAAMVAGIVLILIYVVSIFCGFFSPNDPQEFNKYHTFHPPQRIRFHDGERLHLRPFVYGYDDTRDPVSFKKIFTLNRERQYPLHLFVRGAPYKLLGMIETDIHFFGVKGEDAYYYPFGADNLGRCVFSRILFGGRISTSIGFVGVLLSFILGITLGSLAGYYGGVIDNVIQRIIEILRSIPTIPLWMGLSAALPQNWPVIRLYFGITIILSFIGWTGLARVVRSKFLSLREEDFVMAARFAGARETRVIFVHMLPSFMSHIIASLSLAVPRMILGETSLSFLGLGLRAPAISWGVLLQAAQNVQAVAMAPWLLLPGVAVIITVLAFNFFGDGIRDAADPYGDMKTR
jgi:peptide/nickel transport system permease protein